MSTVQLVRSISLLCLSAADISFSSRRKNLVRLRRRAPFNSESLNMSLAECGREKVRRAVLNIRSDRVDRIRRLVNGCGFGFKFRRNIGNLRLGWPLLQTD
jgi:hypothetical protein